MEEIEAIEEIVADGRAHSLSLRPQVPSFSYGFSGLAGGCTGNGRIPRHGFWNRKMGELLKLSVTGEKCFGIQREEIQAEYGNARNPLSWR